MMTMIDLRNRYVGVAAAAVLAQFTMSVGSAEAARGYQSRACGFDMNRNGTAGEAADCDVCNGTTADPDHDGVNEDLIYVNCGTGNNTTSCGAPSNPCKTIAYAWGTRADGPGDGAEDIICFTGVCKTEENVQPGRGVSGTYTVSPKGSQTRPWEFAKNPSMLVGWDKDGDGDYPPHDADDISVLDGGTNGLDRAISHTNAPSFLEYGHFAAKDYGRTTAALGGIGFVALGASAGGDSSHMYFHDLSLQNIDRDKPASSNTQAFNLWKGGIDTLRYVAISNVECRDCGGFFIRAGFGKAPPVSGPFRLQNISYTGHACDASGGDHLCSDVTTADINTQAKVTVAKLWGYVSGVEILDSSWDANIHNWNPPSRGSVYAIEADQCSQDWDIIGNNFFDWKKTIGISPSSDGFCDGRVTTGVRIEGNVIRNRAPSPWDQIQPIWIDAGGALRTETLEEAVIANNFISSAVGYRTCIWSQAGYGGSCSSHGGRLAIINNTCDGDITYGQFGAITIGNVLGSDTACMHDTYVVKNNMISGITGTNAGFRNIATTYAPRNWQSNNNVWDPEGKWQWNDATTASLATWRQASGGDGASKTCAASYVDRAAGDFHLKAGDVCALDAGTDASTIVKVDIDQGLRPGGSNWDCGADEFGVSGGGVVIPPPPPPPPVDTAPQPPVLLDVVPLPD